MPRVNQDRSMLLPLRRRPFGCRCASRSHCLRKPVAEPGNGLSTGMAQQVARPPFRSVPVRPTLQVLPQILGLFPPFSKTLLGLMLLLLGMPVAETPANVVHVGPHRRNEALLPIRRAWLVPPTMKDRWVPSQAPLYLLPCSLPTLLWMTMCPPQRNTTVAVATLHPVLALALVNQMNWTSTRKQVVDRLNCAKLRRHGLYLSVMRLVQCSSHHEAIGDAARPGRRCRS